MKLNKKIILVSAAALMALSPAIALTQNNEPVFAASKKAAKKKTIKTSANGITLYNKKGNFYTGKKKLRVIAQLRLMVSLFGLLVAFHFCQAIVFQ